MNPSAAMCRAQEAIHQNLASSALLENVRAIALRAAKAWAAEAMTAEGREARGERVRLHRLAHPIMQAAENGFLSENPDRGLAAS